MLCQVNKITGLAGDHARPNLEFDPTLTGRRTDRRAEFPDGSLAKEDEKAEPGLSARWGVTPNAGLERHRQPGLLAGRGRRGAARA